MAEGVLEKLFDREGEEAGEGGGGAPGPDPVAAAIALDAARYDPELSRRAADYLDRHGRLVQLQAEHLHEQRELLLSQLKLRRFTDLAKAAGHLFLTLLALAVVGGIGKMVWDAAHDRRLVVEAFSVPPEFAARGMSGQVMAAQFLDRLGAINAEATSSRAPTSYAANWGEEAKVEIPETGVSVDELKQFLERWLGRETHIKGELVRTPDGLALTVRAGEEPGRTVTGGEDDLGALLDRGAGAAFEATQPYRYSVYLLTHGKSEAALEVAQKLAVADVPARERAWAWTQISNVYLNTGDAARALDAARRAEALDPKVAMALLNEAGAHALLGHDEEVLQRTREAVRLLKSGAPDMSKQTTTYFLISNRAFVDSLQGDFEAAARGHAELVAWPDIEGFSSLFPLATADMLARGHDLASSLRASSDTGSDLKGAMALLSYGVAFTPEYWRAVEREDWTAAVDDMRQAIAAAPDSPGARAYVIPRVLEPRLVYALARGGQQAEADTLASRLPKDCYICLRARGWTALGANDPVWSEREFSAAIQLAPSLPEAYVDRGTGRMRRGDLDGAIADFKAAAKRGPRYADAYKGWGEALARKGRWGQARAQYDKALGLAPSWPALIRARDAAVTGGRT